MNTELDAPVALHRHRKFSTKRQRKTGTEKWRRNGARKQEGYDEYHSLPRSGDSMGGGPF